MVKIKTDFKLVPSKTLSYIIGVQYGDGSIYHYKPKNNFSIRLSTVDREFLEEWGKCCYAVLGKNGKVPINVLTTQYRDCYYSNVYSKKLFYFLSNSLDEHKRYIEVYPAEFVRGFFDSEGCVRNIAHKGLKISANNSNRKLINYIKELLYGLGIRNISFYLTKPGKKSYLYQKNRFIITKATMYEVSFTKYTDLKTFNDKIGFTIKRKQDKITKHLKKFSKKCKLCNFRFIGTTQYQVVCPVCNSFKLTNKEINNLKKLNKPIKKSVNQSKLINKIEIYLEKETDLDECLNIISKFGFTKDTLIERIESEKKLHIVAYIPKGGYYKYQLLFIRRLAKDEENRIIYDMKKVMEVKKKDD